MVRKSVAIKSVPRGGDPGRADNIRQIIFERAIDLFDVKGFRGTSMNEIAEACGVSKPAIYHYFRNKSHLLEMLYESITAEFFRTMEKLAHSTGDANARLRRLIRLQTLHNIENRRFLTIFWRERHEFDELSRTALAIREREFEAWVMRIIEEGIASGEFRQADARTAAFGVLGLLSTVHRWAPYTERQPNEVADEIADLLLVGMTEEKAPERRVMGEETCDFQSCSKEKES
ncbi:TetR family transcriptional regulator [Skermanella aerolata]|jgi:AcrR family transcriptional regulator|uniref:TetR family transcriptional regulator n=1 Tax=Skermanella aerolata TaxID=393310 RepID=A0A512E3L2_9PROT|nr:TetR/AcrR family transcriptional regulator [Skermanella aerolata]KJB90156.1 TetR family transcriptional regulator [Skermanella aerolata KACC 11604]GEO43040.1 TetR family transcriptional regulator [Skermanella aerolata]